MSRLNNSQIGKCGEELVAKHLIQLGWTVVAQNHRCPFAEIDILAFSPNQRLVVVEVKSRRSFSWLDEYDCLSQQQRQRLSKACAYFTSKTKDGLPARLDLALVDLKSNTKSKIRLFKDLDLLN
ncbi:MAG: YraN family protein [Planctomycetota bacterium]|jgi:putative endonuclease|nr:YraN family protein [Planctomycetota bacterium]